MFEFYSYIDQSAIGPVFACASTSLSGQSLGNAEGDVDFVKAIQSYKESVILTSFGQNTRTQ